MESATAPTTTSRTVPAPAARYWDLQIVTPSSPNQRCLRCRASPHGASVQCYLRTPPAPSDLETGGDDGHRLSSLDQEFQERLKVLAREQTQEQLEKKRRRSEVRITVQAESHDELPIVSENEDPMGFQTQTQGHENQDLRAVQAEAQNDAATESQSEDEYPDFNPSKKKPLERLLFGPRTVKHPLPLPFEDLPARKKARLSVITTSSTSLSFPEGNDQEKLALPGPATLWGMLSSTEDESRNESRHSQEGGNSVIGPQQMNETSQTVIPFVRGSFYGSKKGPSEWDTSDEEDEDEAEDDESG